MSILRIRNRANAIRPYPFTQNSALRCYVNRFNFSAMISLNVIFISSGKNDRSINSNHLSFAFANLAKMLLITFSSNPDACIEVTKSVFLRYNPCNTQRATTYGREHQFSNSSRQYPEAILRESNHRKMETAPCHDKVCRSTAK